jgi:hypothetical protein
MTMRESHVETKVCAHAETLGWRSIKLNGSGDRGKPDRLFLTGPPARIIFVEFKRPGEVAKKLQQWWGRLLTKMGFAHHVIDNIDEGKRLFDHAS